ncbi:hypothetical protein FQN60_016511, partial [Etheostoma spectabile]
GEPTEFLSQPLSSCLSLSPVPSPGADCLGLRFTWLHQVFDNHPSLLGFALKLRCATGLCPRDLEDYGCSCRYAASGHPADPLDTQHLPPLPDNFTCSAANTSCGKTHAPKDVLGVLLLCCLAESQTAEVLRLRPGRHRLHGSERLQPDAERPRRRGLHPRKPD